MIGKFPLIEEVPHDEHHRIEEDRQSIEETRLIVEVLQSLGEVHQIAEEHHQSKGAARQIVGGVRRNAEEIPQNVGDHRQTTEKVLQIDEGGHQTVHQSLVVLLNENLMIRISVGLLKVNDPHRKMTKTNQGVTIKYQAKTEPNSNALRDNHDREMPKLKEPEPPNFAVSNKYAFLEPEEDSD